MKNANEYEITQMKRVAMNAVTRTTLGNCIAVVLAMALSGCVSAEAQRHAQLEEDGGTCSDFGARYGSRGHTDCMLRQQQRRDQEQLLNMERARIASETARNNLEMLRIMRERRERRE